MHDFPKVENGRLILEIEDAKRIADHLLLLEKFLTVENRPHNKRAEEVELTAFYLQTAIGRAK